MGQRGAPRQREAGRWETAETKRKGAPSQLMRAAEAGGGCTTSATAGGEAEKKRAGAAAIADQAPNTDDHRESPGTKARAEERGRCSADEGSGSAPSGSLAKLRSPACSRLQLEQGVLN
jgi:hypothetical protein